MWNLSVSGTLNPDIDYIKTAHCNPKPYARRRKKLRRNYFIRIVKFDLKIINQNFIKQKQAVISTEIQFKYSPHVFTLKSNGKLLSHTHHQLIDFTLPNWCFETNLEDVSGSRLIP